MCLCPTIQLALEAAKAGTGVVVFSLEMSREALIQRLVCQQGRIDSHRLRQGYLNQEERGRAMEAAETLSKLPLHIDDSTAGTPAAVRSVLRRLQTRQTIGLVIVDYVQLLQGSQRAGNRTEELSSISRALKLAAKEFNCPFVVLSQLNRATETRASRDGGPRPRLADLRDSGALEQDADLVLFIYREEVYKPDCENLHGVAELICAKQRNGPTAKVDLVFLNRCGRFEDRSAIGQPRPTDGTSVRKT